MKDCPYCKGSIADEALKCKHCGEWVVPRTDPPTAAPVDRAGGVPRTGSAGNSDGMRMIGEAAKTGVAFYIVMSVVGLLIGLVFLVGFWLPQWNKMDRQHDEFRKKFDADWEKARKRSEEFERKFDEQWGR